MVGKGLMKIGGEEFLVVVPEPENWPPDTLSKYDFYVSRRYFIEKTTDGILAGEDVFMAPHWKSIYGDVGFTIDWFPEKRAFQIFEGEK